MHSVYIFDMARERLCVLFYSRFIVVAIAVLYTQNIIYIYPFEFNRWIEHEQQQPTSLAYMNWKYIICYIP